MPRFFLDLYNGFGSSLDDVGSEYPDQSAARLAAIESIRSIVSEESRLGTIDLTGHIDLLDDGRNCLLQIPFLEAFDIKVPSPGAKS